jgi:hypothetical protein
LGRCVAIAFALAAFVGHGPLLAQTELPATISDADRRSLSALPVEGTIVVDGRLDDATWQRPSQGGFVQSEPREGQAASEATEVWVAFDGATLYVAARLHDREASTISDIRKDFDDSNQDVFQVILDTFHDRRNGYVFQTNPAGARGDRQIANEGREINRSWDAVWRVETQRFEGGWSVEMAIPFRSLRFAPGADTWGINFGRLLRRNNEVSYWAPIPRAYTFNRLSLAGDLQGIPAATASRDLRVKPYGLANTVRETGGTTFARDGQVGADAKYGLTQGLTLDLTANPDFAQVEADQQRVNLTQFSLFYEEKREFFLENSGVFYVGDAARNVRIRLTPTPDEDLLLFFSRRIGIGADRRPIPIVGGTRLTGQAAGLVVGGMWMRTDDSGTTPGSDYGVVRVRKNVLRGSDIGGIFMMRDAVDDPGNFNRVYGVDSYIRFPGEIDWSTYYVMTESPNFDSGEYAWRTSLNREGNFHHIKLGLMELGDGFQNDLGFYRRTGIRKYFIDWGVRPRPESFRAIGVREIHPHITWNYYENLAGLHVAKKLHSGVTLFLEAGGNIQLAMDRTTERIDAPFLIDPTVPGIPIGRHDWDAWVLSGGTDASRLLAVTWNITRGGLWTGTQRSYSGGVTVRPTYQFRTTISLDRTEADLGVTNGSFNKTFWTTRTNYSFNEDMFVDALVQYDPRSRQLNSNVRFNWIHSPLSDVFLVWNEQRFENGEGIRPGRSLTLKVTKMFSF